MAAHQLGRQPRLPRRRAAPTGDARAAARDRGARAARARAGLAALVQRRRRLRRAGLARRPGRPTSSSTARPATVTCGAGLTYGELAPLLAAQGVALHNLASLPHISIGGRDRHRHPRLRRRQRQPRHGGRARSSSSPRTARCSRCRGVRRTSTASSSASARWAWSRASPSTSSPHYEVRQRVFEGLSWDALHERFDAITAARLQRQRLHPLGRDGRPGVGQEPRHRRARGGARRALRRGRGDARPPPDPRPRSRPLHAAARRPGRVVGSPAALPDGLHAQQRRGDPVRVPRRAATTPRGRSAPSTPWPTRCAPCSRSPRSARSPPTSCG